MDELTYCKSETTDYSLPILLFLCLVDSNLQMWKMLPLHASEQGIEHFIKLPFQSSWSSYGPMAVNFCCYIFCLVLLCPACLGVL